MYEKVIQGITSSSTEKGGLTFETPPMISLRRRRTAAGPRIVAAPSALDVAAWADWRRNC